MKATTISHTRRQLMIAAVAGAATPAVTFAASPASNATNPGISIAQGDSLLVSGRVLDAAGKPLAGARVELLQHGIAGAADGDGRFVLKTTASRPSRGVLCRVSDGKRSQVRYLSFARKHRAEREGIAVLDRDEQGTWRTTCGLTLA